MPAAPDVFLHIGLPKTGTTYLQRVLWNSRDRLAGAGVLVPGDARMDQSFAVWDLLGRRPRDADQPGVAGSWPALVRAAGGWTGTHVVVSEELLAMATARQAARAVRAFAPARVHLVLTVKDLVRGIVGAWQQELVKGQTLSLAEYTAACQDPGAAHASAGVSFWLRQDLVRVLDRWERVVPRERVHLVTVPPPGAPPVTLLERFAAATAIQLSWLDATEEIANASVGTAEAEVLRRLNDRLRGSLNERQLVKVVKRTVQPALQARRGARIDVPGEHRPWLIEASRTTVQTLRDREYDVAGDLDDLLPPAAGQASARPTEAPDRDVADAALDALAAVARQYAESWWQGRSKERRGAGAGGLASARRAQTYRFRRAVLLLADRNRAVRWLVSRRVHQ